MKVVRNEKGFIKVIFVVGLLIFLVYAGFQFGIPYYKYSAFKSDAKEIARISLGQPDKTKAQIFEKAQEIKIPITEEDIIVERTAKSIKVQTEWSETVDIMGFYQKRLDFTIDIEEALLL
jgi:hypothetical protein